MVRTGLWIMVFLPMGLYRGAVWCGVKREAHQCKECLGVPGFQDILCFRACSNPELRVILAPFQWNCRQLFLFGDHTAKKGAKTTVGSRLRLFLHYVLRKATYYSLQSTTPMMPCYIICVRGLGKSIRKKLSSWRLKKMHPILVLYFAFKEEGRAIEKRKKSYQW